MRKILGICIFFLVIILFAAGGIFFLLGISPGQYDFSYVIGNGSYTLHRTNGTTIWIAPNEEAINETNIIPEKVVEIAWNNQYVIAKQYGLKRENPNSTYKVPDETDVNYWILDTENKLRYGPYSYDEYSTKIQEFHLTDLELKSVYSYIEE